jgi:hypothetical protein
MLPEYLVMKNGEERDRRAVEDKAMCFEMGAADLTNDFPCWVPAIDHFVVRCKDWRDTSSLSDLASLVAEILSFTALLALARRSSALSFFFDHIEESIPQYPRSMARPRMLYNDSPLLSLQGFLPTRHHSFLFMLLNKPILISIR